MYLTWVKLQMIILAHFTSWIPRDSYFEHVLCYLLNDTHKNTAKMNELICIASLKNYSGSLIALPLLIYKSSRWLRNIPATPRAAQYIAPHGAAATLGIQCCAKLFDRWSRSTFLIFFSPQTWSAMPWTHPNSLYLPRSSPLGGVSQLTTGFCTSRQPLHL